MNEGKATTEIQDNDELFTDEYFDHRRPDSNLTSITEVKLYREPVKHIN